MLTIVLFLLTNLLSSNAAAITSTDSLDIRADKNAGAVCKAKYHVEAHAFTSDVQGCDVFMFSACCEDTHKDMHFNKAHWGMKCHKTAKGRPDLPDVRDVQTGTCKKGWSDLPFMYGGCVKGDPPKSYFEGKCK